MVGGIASFETFETPDPQDEDEEPEWHGLSDLGKARVFASIMEMAADAALHVFSLLIVEEHSRQCRLSVLLGARVIDRASTLRRRRSSCLQENRQLDDMSSPYL